MTKKHSLATILAISLFGVLFSGTLTYLEFCSRTGADGCSDVGPAGTILGYPPCVYGLVMYALLTVIAALGLRAKQ
ncbi:MAG: hypothetical protein OEW17_00115 [Gemmatimonadota bacterium]|nr:hypothetical protein [Gemmatimonadota bacterium]MDH4347183.1 hypothetical protein [Gemmatimonadota bacterium]